jgi:PEP-CTERM motif
MKKSILSFFLFGALLSAAPVNVTFIDAGHPAQVAYGAEVGPYDLNVNGHTVQAMCMDDFLTAGGSWKANVTLLNSSDLSKTYLGQAIGSGSHSFDVAGFGGINFGAKDFYSAEAYLLNSILQLGSDRVDIQEAVWAIMDPNTFSKILSTRNTAVLTILNDTYSHYKGFDTTGYEILSDISDCNRNQEFIIKCDPVSGAPEPATFAMIGGGLLAASAARFFRRKKMPEVKS